MNQKFRPIGLVFLMITLTVFCISACGRTPSRYLGKDSRQVLHVKHMKEFISISYDTRDGSTVKDVTILADDGYIYTVEFKDISPFGGVIRWVPSNEPESVIQTRAISRFTGGTVNLKLPQDCEKVLGVAITYASQTERTKMLTYRTTDGKILSKEYREGFLDRHFEGWLEVKKAE